MATIVEMGIIVQQGEFPTIKVEAREDARALVKLLTRYGVAVNLREVPDENPNAGLEAWADRYMAERGIEPTPEGQTLADRVARGEA